jgi:Ca-activated chloride channel homolog
LATDGDFNVGASSDKDMKNLIEEKRESGVFLSVLGFGYGNYKDSKLETLADKGNGNHAYIDTMQEAQKVFGKEFGGTL